MFALTGVGKALPGVQSMADSLFSGLATDAQTSVDAVGRSLCEMTRGWPWGGSIRRDWPR